MPNSLIRLPMPSVNPKRAHRPECWLLRRYVMERIRDLYGVTL